MRSEVLYLALFATFSLTGCGEVTSTVEVDLPESSEQAELNEISDACDSPREFLTIEDDQVQFRPDPDMDYDKAACVLSGIQNAGITNFGFVGNERFQTPEGQ